MKSKKDKKKTYVDSYIESDLKFIDSIKSYCIDNKDKFNNKDLEECFSFVYSSLSREYNFDFLSNYYKDKLENTKLVSIKLIKRYVIVISVLFACICCVSIPLLVSSYTVWFGAAVFVSLLTLISYFIFKIVFISFKKIDRISFTDSINILINNYVFNKDNKMSLIKYFKDGSNNEIYSFLDKYIPFDRAKLVSNYIGFDCLSYEYVEFDSLEFEKKKDRLDYDMIEKEILKIRNKAKFNFSGLFIKLKNKDNKLIKLLHSDEFFFVSDNDLGITRYANKTFYNIINDFVPNEYVKTDYKGLNMQLVLLSKYDDNLNSKRIDSFNNSSKDLVVSMYDKIREIFIDKNMNILIDESNIYLLIEDYYLASLRNNSVSYNTLDLMVLIYLDCVRIKKACDVLNLK